MLFSFQFSGEYPSKLNVSGGDMTLTVCDEIYSQLFFVVANTVEQSTTEVLP
jgi:hypothetical protein